MTDVQTEVDIRDQQIVCHVKGFANTIAARATRVWDAGRCRIFIQRDDVPGKGLGCGITVIVPNAHIDGVRTSRGWECALTTLGKPKVNVENPVRVITLGVTRHKEIIDEGLVVRSAW